MINIVQGDLLDAKEKYIVHQCNCISQKSAHLAAAVFGRYPYADVYTGRVAPNNPGTILIKGDGKSQRYVINIFGQYYPGSPKFTNSSLDGSKIREKYFHQCLLELVKVQDLESVAFPYRIGCGAAGGNWKYYLGTLHNFSEFVKSEVFLYCLTEQDFKNAEMDYRSFQA